MRGCAQRRGLPHEGNREGTGVDDALWRWRCPALRRRRLSRRLLPQTAPADPARLAAAGKVVAKLVPQGIYLRMMRDAFPQMMDAMIGQMSGLTPADLGEKDTSGKTLEQSAARARPRLSRAHDDHDARDQR